MKRKGKGRGKHSGAYLAHVAHQEHRGVFVGIRKGKGKSKGKPRRALAGARTILDVTDGDCNATGAILRGTW